MFNTKIYTSQNLLYQKV